MLVRWNTVGNSLTVKKCKKKTINLLTSEIFKPKYINFLEINVFNVWGKTVKLFIPVKSTEP